MSTHRTAPDPAGFLHPICSSSDAKQACDHAFSWRGQSIEDGELITDRLIEIVAFRATELWVRHHGAHGQPGMFLALPVFSTQQQSPELLVPVMGYPELGLGKSKGHAPNFYDEATCEALLGSMLLGELFRRVMCARFGPPVGTSATHHIQSNWPEPPLWQGVDAVLAALMTSEHRVRREARLLELATQRPAHASDQRRL
jgi:hypothetical protein